MKDEEIGKRYVQNPAPGSAVKQLKQMIEKTEASDFHGENIVDPKA